MKTAIPILDFKKMDIDASHGALRGVGTIYLIGHGIDLSLQKKIFQLSRDFFSLPQEDKMKISMDKGGLAWRGYFPIGWEQTSGRADQKEGLYFGSESKKNLPLHGVNLWPNHEFEKVVLTYLEQMTELGQKLMRAIALGLGLPENYFAARFTKNPTTLFRIFNYPKHSWPASRDEWGVREHTDMGFLTILLQDENPGLEVKTRAGEWIEVPPIENSFVVNIGDMLEVWTQGIYRATPHRVKNKAAGDRMSLPFFFDPSWNTTLEPIARDELNSQSLKDVSLETKKRWDGLELNKLSDQMTYGEFVWNKVKDVFPNLSDD